MSPNNAEVCVNKAKSTKSKVSFSEVQVRMYPITLGHNPGGVEGPPLSLSWNYTSLGRATVEDFENHRKQPQFRRRDLKHLHISAGRRVGLLRKAGFTDRQIYEAAREASMERKCRRTSVQDAIAKCRALKAQKAAALAKAKLSDVEETGQAALLKIDQES